ncbi:MAG: PTS sugar transporter subunit IIA [Firmicutes bacterium]|uniref:PTS sugar transporter subunit IIA n=1 Tax=Candidatus Scybalomonas excrementavium TaxID=2840943 RepID=A0A9D9I138_9FIRM|nr:PTS sugar transporter subunit IIA [Candidatus Scybalomonas excrementavium]
MEEIIFQEEQVLKLVGFKTKEEVLSEIADTLCQQGIVKETYKEAILNREKEFPTGLNTGGINLAIPHADVAHVNKPAIAIAILDKPVEFQAMDEPEQTIFVQVVVMLALKEAHGHIEMLQKVVGLIQDQELVKQVIELEDKTEICNKIKGKLF